MWSSERVFSQRASIELRATKLLGATARRARPKGKGGARRRGERFVLRLCNVDNWLSLPRPWRGRRGDCRGVAPLPWRGRACAQRARRAKWAARRRNARLVLLRTPATGQPHRFGSSAFLASARETRFPRAAVREVAAKTFAGRLCFLLSDPSRNLVDPASSHMLVSTIKPCMSQHKSLRVDAANGSLQQL